jgi:Ca-activated chloride channel family protein
MNHSRFLLSLLTLASLTGCSDMAMSSAGDMGVTQGGSQDIKIAREIIEEGGIPGHSYFSSEGLFSEHDLPLSGEDCDEILCPRSAAAVYTPVDEPSERLLVQLGFGTAITADTFQRLPLNLSLAVDISGSMGTDKMEAVQDALAVMVEQLDGGDRLSIVAFDDRAELRLDPMMMDEAGREAAKKVIRGLDSRGSTNIEAGLALAFDQVAPLAGQAGVGDRVMLFTDAQPNVGGTSIGSFEGMVTWYAAAGIGTSVFGVGLDLGADLADAISRTRGANYFYLADEETIRAVFDDEFDYMVTPLAYDLEVAVAAVDGLRFERGYGAPVEGATSTIEFGTSTLFLSSKSGGMGAELVAGEERSLVDLEGPLGEMDLTFETVDGRIVEKSLTLSFDGGTAYESDSTAADDLGVYKMAVLVAEYHALQAGADFCEGSIDMSEASARIHEAARRLEVVSADLQDAPLAEEAALMGRLAENLAGGRCW